MASTNIWKAFEQLLPQTTFLIGKVTEIQGTRSKVQLSSGEYLMVNGASVAIGKKAQVVNGLITAEAKDFTVQNAEV